MLFDLALIPGLKLRNDLIDAAEERSLIEHIGAEALTPFQFQQYEGKRLTRSFGFHYDFAQQRLLAGEPIPDWLKPVRERCAEFAGVAVDDLVQALLIRYDPGAGIGWHRDRLVFEQVIGVSLAAATTLDFRRRTGQRQFERLSVGLARCSVYLLSGEARRAWEHGIKAHAERRFSITFRTLR